MKVKDIKDGEFYIYLEKDMLIKMITTYVKTKSTCTMYYRYVDKSDGTWVVKEDAIFGSNMIQDIIFQEVPLKEYDLEKKYMKDYEWLGGTKKKLSKMEFINE